MDDQVYRFKPVGMVRSWYVTKVCAIMIAIALNYLNLNFKFFFKRKNATPRQASVVPESKGSIELNKTFFDKPYCSLENLDEFSHIW